MAQFARSIRTYLPGALAALALVFAPPAMADTSPAPPANALILFGAHWCAPCTAELRNLDQILARLVLLQASSPQLVLAWIDRPVSPTTVSRALGARPDSRQAVPHVVIPTPATAVAWAEPHMDRAHGLPFAVLTDAHGTVCALHQGAVQAETIGAMWTACHPGP